MKDDLKQKDDLYSKLRKRLDYLEQKLKDTNQARGEFKKISNKILKILNLWQNLVNNFNRLHFNDFLNKSPIVFKKFQHKF